MKWHLESNQCVTLELLKLKKSFSLDQGITKNPTFSLGIHLLPIVESIHLTWECTVFDESLII